MPTTTDLVTRPTQKRNHFTLTTTLCFVTSDSTHVSTIEHSYRILHPKCDRGLYRGQTMLKVMIWFQVHPNHRNYHLYISLHCHVQTHWHRFLYKLRRQIIYWIKSLSLICWFTRFWSLDQRWLTFTPATWKGEQLVQINECQSRWPASHYECSSART